MYSGKELFPISGRHNKRNNIAYTGGHVNWVKDNAPLVWHFETLRKTGE